VVVTIRLITALFAVSAAGVAQIPAGAMSGVITAGKQPVGNARIEAREHGGLNAVRVVTSGLDGAYVLSGVAAGTYDLKITATGFYSAEIRGIEIHAAEVRVPAVPLAVGLIADCGTERRPTYYRLSASPGGFGELAGRVLGGKEVAVSGATVTLFFKGYGRIGSQRTSSDGTFAFAGLTTQDREYWVSIEHEGYFAEEVEHLFVVPGLEAVYLGIRMQSCSPGSCQPQLKPVRVIGPCA
jgi:hypothetical protein